MPRGGAASACCVCRSTPSASPGGWHSSFSELAPTGRPPPPPQGRQSPTTSLRTRTTRPTAVPAAVPAAIADGDTPSSCSFGALSALPEVLGQVNKLASGDPKTALAAFQQEPLLADKNQLSSAMDACAADATTRKEADAKYASLRDELEYQAGKTYDPRWPDPEDAAELGAAVKKMKSAMERFLASVPEAQRA